MNKNRQGFNLFTRIGWANTIEWMRRGWDGVRWVQRYVFRDSLTWIVCRMSGGCEPYRPEEGVRICFWCHGRLEDE